MSLIPQVQSLVRSTNVAHILSLIYIAIHRSKLDVRIGSCELLIPKLLVLHMGLTLIAITVVEVTRLIIDFAFFKLSEISFDQLFVYLGLAFTELCMARVVPKRTIFSLGK